MVEEAGGVKEWWWLLYRVGRTILIIMLGNKLLLVLEVPMGRRTDKLNEWPEEQMDFAGWGMVLGGRKDTVNFPFDVFIGKLWVVHSATLSRYYTDYCPLRRQHRLWQCDYWTQKIITGVKGWVKEQALEERVRLSKGALPGDVDGSAFSDSLW